MIILVYYLWYMRFNLGLCNDNFLCVKYCSLFFFANFFVGSGQTASIGSHAQDLKDNSSFFESLILDGPLLQLTKA